MYTVIRSALSCRAAFGALIFVSFIPQPAVGQAGGDVSGRLTVLDKRDRQARDVGQAVVWLETERRHAVTQDTVQVVMSNKSFQPGVIVVTAGTTISYPNTDGFNHNVFSLSPEGPFDLGLYGRGQEKQTRLNQPGVLRVYCNVHARMNSYVVVRDNPFFAQPARDGSFAIPNVPPGRYQLVAWHERAAEMVRRPVVVTATGLAQLEIGLDARGYKREQHKDKHGRPYTRRGRRY